MNITINDLLKLVNIYNEDEVEMPEEDFGYHEPVSGETLTDDILQNLDDDLNAESG